jgi:hypothetical protein
MDLGRARLRCVQAARWLVLIGYRPVPRYWQLGPRHPAYHDLVDPVAGDGRRLHACRSLLPRLRLHVAIERETAMAADPPGSWEDPYGQAWRTTLCGAALETAEDHLSRAAAAFEGAGVAPEAPTMETLARIGA